MSFDAETLVKDSDSRWESYPGGDSMWAWGAAW